MNTPNWITLSRVLMVPGLVYALFQNTEYWNAIAVIVFSVAAITDFFDGYLARLNNQVSLIGKLMDPLADKILVIASIVMLQHLARIHPVVVILLISREIVITGLRALASAEGIVIGASGSGKWKTATQMVALPMMMLPQGLGPIPTLRMGEVLLYTSLGISFWSARGYFVDFFRGIRKPRHSR